MLVIFLSGHLGGFLTQCPTKGDQVLDTGDGSRAGEAQVAGLLGAGDEMVEEENVETGQRL